MSTRALISPVAGRALGGAGAYGWRTHPVTGKRGDFHAGQDVACPTGTPVRAPEPGRVAFVGWAGSGLAAYRSGIAVIVRGDWTGQDHYFGHCSRTRVKRDQRVAQGDLVADSGATGNVTGPHVHVEVRRAGTTTTADPMPFYKRYGAELGAAAPLPPSPPKRDWLTMATEKDVENALEKVLLRNLSKIAREVQMYNITIAGATRSALGVKTITSAQADRYSTATLFEARNQHRAVMARLAAITGAVSGLSKNRALGAVELRALVDGAVADLDVDTEDVNPDPDPDQ